MEYEIGGDRKSSITAQLTKIGSRKSHTTSVLKQVGPTKAIL